MSFATTSQSEERFTTAAAETKPVTVTVVGTNISTTVDGSGHFHLQNVPTGDVQLKFTATGLDATITLVGVEAGDEIHIKVRVTDTRVRIEAETRERHERQDELEGRVAALAGTCPDITFTVDGTTVKTTSATRFDDVTCAQVRNDLRVKVKGVRQSDGSLRAVEVKEED